MASASAGTSTSASARIGDDPGRRRGVEPASGLRLSPREWPVAALLVALAGGGAVAGWDRLEPARFDGAYRLPQALRDDYWAFGRWAAHAGAEGRVLVIGDSAVWGHFVAAEDALPAALERAVAALGDGPGRAPRFANLGLDGLHGLALEGLVRHHGGPLRERRVLAYWNFTWLQDARADLSAAGGAPAHHPRLLPQLDPSLRGYRASAEARLTILAEQRLRLFALRRHWRLRYYGDVDASAWLVRYPGRWPPAALLDRPGALAPDPARSRTTWRERGIPVADVAWVAPAGSRQWRAFRAAVRRLRADGADVLVVVGTFNRHLLAPASAARFDRVRDESRADLAREGIPAVALPVLGADDYADASHPLAAGYEAAARALARDPVFRRWLAAGVGREREEGR